MTMEWPPRPAAPISTISKSDKEIVACENPSLLTPVEWMRRLQIGYMLPKPVFVLTDEEILAAGSGLQGYMTDEQWRRRSQLQNGLKKSTPEGQHFS